MHSTCRALNADTEPAAGDTANTQTGFSACLRGSARGLGCGKSNMSTHQLPCFVVVERAVELQEASDQSIAGQRFTFGCHHWESHSIPV